MHVKSHSVLTITIQGEYPFSHLKETAQRSQAKAQRQSPKPYWLPDCKAQACFPAFPSDTLSETISDHLKVAQPNRRFNSLTGSWHFHDFQESAFASRVWMAALSEWCFFFLCFFLHVHVVHHHPPQPRQSLPSRSVSQSLDTVFPFFWCFSGTNIQASGYNGD